MLEFVRDASREVTASIVASAHEAGFDTLFDVSYVTKPSEQRLMAATILIADDYEDNRELLRLLLAAEHYTILEAANGKDCLTMARESRPDLILIDL